MADVQPVQGISKTPADFLKSIKGKPVIVKLNSGVDYRGARAAGGRGVRCAACCRCCNVENTPIVVGRRITQYKHKQKQTTIHNQHTKKGVLACLDGYMNIAMEQTEEYVNGQLKNKYGDAFIRGNNGE